MSVQKEVLGAAIELCRRRGGWRFRPSEIVRALPQLSPGTVRNHVVSRCCVNAPRNHPHTLDYFERVERGVYEIRRPYRRRVARREPQVAETRLSYGSEPLRETIHAVVTESPGWYVAECLGLAVVTQGRTLDETVHNLREAIALHLEGEDASLLGVSPRPRLTVTCELAPLPAE